MKSAAAAQAQMQMNLSFSVKMISLGDVEVGKSCLIKRYCEGDFVEEYKFNRKILRRNIYF